MFDYKVRLEKLFQEWKQREPHRSNKNFIEDGIIDLIRWNKSEIKVLFILREAYQEVGKSGGFNLAKNLLVEQGQKKNKTTWVNLAKWAYLLQNIKASDLNLNASKDWFFYEDAFLSSAIMNVKKSGGTKRSDINEIIRLAQLDADLLSKQIDLIKPDIICCCGVFGSVKGLWPSIEKTGNRLYRYEGYRIVDFWHPATLWSQDLFYFGLKGIVDQ